MLGFAYGDGSVYPQAVDHATRPTNFRIGLQFRDIDVIRKRNALLSNEHKISIYVEMVKESLEIPEDQFVTVQSTIIVLLGRYLIAMIFALKMKAYAPMIVPLDY